MKNLHLTCLLFLSIFVLSCSSDDDNGSNENQIENQAEAQDPGFEAAINGGTFSNYSFILGAYLITPGNNGNTISIDAVDTQGNAINLFLNGTDGFGNDTVKQIGNIDSDNFMTNVVIRDLQSPVTYFSSTGNITITSNRQHPTKSDIRLISGNYNITASTIDGLNTTVLTGTFTELEF